MDEDDFVRDLIVGGTLLLAIVYVVQGFLSSVKGLWQDQEKVIQLRQFGPWLLGESVVTGGKQIYKGYMLLGVLRLKRWDFGGAHLQELGFSVDQTEKLEGSVTGHFRLKQVDGHLVGQFFGRKFTFDEKNTVTTSVVAPTPRQWRRILS